MRIASLPPGLASAQTIYRQAGARSDAAMKALLNATSDENLDTEALAEAIVSVKQAEIGMAAAGTLFKAQNENMQQLLDILA